MDRILLQFSLPILPQDVAFKVVYGRDPPSVCAYTLGEARLLVVHHQMMDQDEFLAKVWDRLEQAQHHYKMLYNCKHRDFLFKVEQWVWLCLLHPSLASLDIKNCSKLDPKSYGHSRSWNGSTTSRIGYSSHPVPSSTMFFISTSCRNKYVCPGTSFHTYRIENGYRITNVTIYNINSYNNIVFQKTKANLSKTQQRKGTITPQAIDQG
jgi:hypothetical protein